LSEFSVLIPVYVKANADQFDSALQSIWDKQILKPTEVVIIEDGPLTEELYRTIKSWEEKIRSSLVVVKLEKNQGLGRALQAGLLTCKFDIVARMDADDLSLPERFEIQIKYLEENKNISVVGSHVEEFFDEQDSPNQIKRVPLTYQDIVKFSKYRNPINHPTVMFRKTAILESGGYQDRPLFEDYDLWVRVVLKGFLLANIDAVMVKMRTDLAQTSRRGGWLYFFNEVKFHFNLVKLKHVDIIQFLRNIILRLPLRIVPVTIRLKVYKLLRKR